MKCTVCFFIIFLVLLVESVDRGEWNEVFLSKKQKTKKETKDVKCLLHKYRFFPYGAYKNNQHKKVNKKEEPASPMEKTQSMEISEDNSYNLNIKLIPVEVDDACSKNGDMIGFKKNIPEQKEEKSEYEDIIDILTSDYSENNKSSCSKFDDELKDANHSLYGNDFESFLCWINDDVNVPTIEDALGSNNFSNLNGNEDVKISEPKECVNQHDDKQDSFVNSSVQYRKTASNKTTQDSFTYLKRNYSKNYMNINTPTNYNYMSPNYNHIPTNYNTTYSNYNNDYTYYNNTNNYNNYNNINSYANYNNTNGYNNYINTNGYNNYNHRYSHYNHRYTNYQNGCTLNTSTYYNWPINNCYISNGTLWVNPNKKRESKKNRRKESNEEYNNEYERKKIKLEKEIKENSKKSNVNEQSEYIPIVNKPSENKQGENKSGENKQNKNKQNKHKPSENKQSKNIPNGNKPNEDKPNEDKPSENEQSKNIPNGNKSSEDKPSEDKPSEDKPSEDKPSEDPSNIIHNYYKKKRRKKKKNIRIKVTTKKETEETEQLVIIDENESKSLLFLLIEPYFHSIFSVMKKIEIDTNFETCENLKELKKLIHKIKGNKFHYNEFDRSSFKICVRRINSTMKTLNTVPFNLKGEDSSYDRVLDIMDSLPLSQMYLMFVSIFSPRILRTQKDYFLKLAKNKKEVFKKIPSDGQSLHFNNITLQEIFDDLFFVNMKQRTFRKMELYYRGIYYMSNRDDISKEKSFDTIINNILSEVTELLNVIKNESAVLRTLKKVTYGEVLWSVEKVETSGSDKKLRNFIKSLEEKQYEMRQKIKCLLPDPSHIASFIKYNFTVLGFQRLLAQLKKDDELKDCIGTFKAFLNTCNQVTDPLLESNNLSESELHKHMIRCIDSDDLLNQVNLYVYFSFIKNNLNLLNTYQSKVTNHMKNHSFSEMDYVDLDFLKEIKDIYKMKLSHLENFINVLHLINGNRCVLKKYMKIRNICDTLSYRISRVSVYVKALDENSIIEEKNKKLIISEYDDIVKLYNNFFSLTKSLNTEEDSD